MTQEALAEKLDVSRQTISKWESDQCYPEMEKILILCDMFECNMDTLMRGNLLDENANTSDEQEAGQGTEQKTENTPPEKKQYSDITKEKYEKHMNKFSISIASSVFLIIFGVSLLIFIDSFNVRGFISAAILMSLIAIAVFVIILSGIKHSEFEKENPLIKNFYTKEERSTFGKKFSFMIASGVALILVGIILLIMSEGFSQNPYIIENRFASLFMLFVAIAVFLFIFGGIQYSKYDIEERNKAITKEGKTSLSEAICGAIMLVATAIFLFAGIVFNMWHPAWVVFPIGGILCGIVSTLFDVSKK